MIKQSIQSSLFKVVFVFTLVILLLVITACSGPLAGQATVTSSQAVSCVDSDGGLKYTLKGQTYFKDVQGGVIPPKYTDICGSSVNEDRLQEFSCLGKTRIKDTWATCAAKQFCDDGACKNPSSCTDSDKGINLLVKGTVSRVLGSLKISRTDICASTISVKEYSCTSSVPLVRICPSSRTCTDGACVCSAGLTSCGTACADVQTDERNCGRCGVRCVPGVTCEEGMCLPPEPIVLG